MPGRTSIDQPKRDRVKRELERLEALFQGVDENKKDFVQRQIEELAWFNVSIADLQKQLDEEGLVTEFQNGKNQSGLQQHPATKSLDTFGKHVNTIVRTLLPLVPEKRSGMSKLDMFRLGDDLELDLEKV